MGLDRLFARIKDPWWRGIRWFLRRHGWRDNFHVQVAVITERLVREQVTQDNVTVLLDGFFQGILQIFSETIAPR